MGVRQHIDEDLVDCIGVCHHQWNIAWHIDFDSPSRIITRSRNRARDEGSQVGRAEIKPLVASLHPLEVKEVID